MIERFWGGSRRRFDSLSQQEILALAISSEEDDARIYRNYADGLQQDYPSTARIFEGMAEEEDGHRRRLIELYQSKFGDTVPLIRREHVAGFYHRKPDWLVRPLGLEKVREQAGAMEHQARRFYEQAAHRATDADLRKLLGDLAAAEAQHQDRAEGLIEEHLGPSERLTEDDAERRRFILTYVQPGLAGLMDGSVSTLAPIFAAAFATHDTWQTFLVGLAASVGAGISMGFTEVASDDGVISGRGSPIKRGFATGIMTTLGGLGHALPYLIPHFWTATLTAIAIVVVELFVIAWIQRRYMETPWSRALFQVVLGGALVFAAGMLIGTA
ncbi:iron exporter MbfA [Notoacmeibacter ruber]|uniref:Rubrerythrin family protein n=1 Tax=Notoacmeibacter ruber TaxID=2670375 RepID=A0A3L7JEQ9_9HYPH|nr:ferritin family protein [Notoacmeibacter ruber]RLQ86962.1 rubrerythrin family protein [Notoacmeibacter ruber]